MIFFFLFAPMVRAVIVFVLGWKLSTPLNANKVTASYDQHLDVLVRNQV